MRQTFSLQHCVERAFLAWFTPFQPDSIISLLQKKISFHNHVWPCFRYDGGGGDLVPLYLVTQKVLEDEYFRVGTISYGLQSLIVRIEKCSFKILGVF